MRPLSDFTHELLDNLAALPSTDQEWEAHDEAVARARATAEAELERQRQDELRRNLVERGCPAKDLERVLAGDLRQTKALAAASAALRSSNGDQPRGDLPRLIIVLAGGPGTGKTTAAAWWIMQRRGGRRYLRTSPPLFVDAARLARWPRYDDARMAELERAEALVIDDLGIEYDDSKGAFRSLLDEVVNARYAAQLPTLITTNLPADQFKTRYGERVADRIRECGTFVDDSGPSLRRRTP